MVIGMGGIVKNEYWTEKEKFAILANKLIN